MNEGKVFTEVTDEGRAFQTVGAARVKALSARITQLYSEQVCIQALA